MLKLSVFFLYLIGLNATAQEMLFNQEVVDAEQQIEEIGNQEAIDRLKAYKETVEKEAYKTTLQLCEGYRRAAGMGPHPYHGRYMFSLDEAGAAWGKVIAEGTMHSFSAIGGLKADYIEIANVGFFDFESWFNSMYTKFLINSDGFLKGAVHCLNSVSKTDINQLAAAIVIADQESTLATEIGITLSGGKVIGVLGKVIKNSRWYVGIGRFFGSKIPTRLRAPLFYTSVGSLGLGLGTFLYTKVQAKFIVQTKKDEILSVIESENSAALDMQLLLNAFDLLQAANEKELIATNLIPESKTFIYKDFSSYMNENFDPKTEVRMLLDLKEYRKNNPSISLEEMPVYYLMIEIVFQQKQELRNLQ
ncbi:MAG: hypothetical protein KDD37_05620 [Bdellovibrionales bacterium]|nr:hypothetical protein [Bdellovibrionales bacterium]